MPGAQLIEKRMHDPVVGRIRWVGAGCALIATVILLRAGQVQLIGDERLANLSRRQFHSRVIVRPRRGPILDRNHEALAVNVETRSLAANPLKVGGRPRGSAHSLVRVLSRALELPAARLSDRFDNSKREFVWVKRHLSESDLARLKKWGLMDRTGELTGDAVGALWLVKESKRVYPQGGLAAHVLGSVNVDSEGLEGVELWANKRLVGRGAPVRIVRDALGRNTFLDVRAVQDVEDGKPVELSLDASLQFSVEQDLRQAIIKTRARAGTVIVMNAENGEILALANEPSFDPNRDGARSRGDLAMRRNRALTDGYEPGSTLKPVLLSLALEKGMHLTDRISGEGGSITVQKHKISEAETHEKFGLISLQDMIKLSSNVVAAKLAMKLGAKTLRDHLTVFGLGGATGSGFPGEISGILPRLPWQQIHLANVGFGHGVMVTPIQMIRAYAAIANGGWLVQPTFFKQAWEGYAVKPPAQILTERVSAQVTEALLSVTGVDGTGAQAVPPGYRVAGKTGTSQMIDPESGAYSRTRYQASFVGFPVGVPLKVVILAMLQEPQGVYYGAQIAAPLFRSVLQATVNRFGIPATESTEDQAPQLGKNDIPPDALPPGDLSDRVRWSLAKVSEAPPATAPPMPVVSMEPDPAANLPGERMPDLKGFGPRESLAALTKLGTGSRVEVRGFGVVKSQSPEPGQILDPETKVRLWLDEP